MKFLFRIPIILTSLSICAAFLPAHVFAQNGGFAGAFTRMGFGPRGMAMGNALTAYSGEGVFAHYNPALAARAGDDIQIDIGTAVLEFDRSLHMVSGTFALPPKAGFSFSFLNANVSDIDGRTVSGFDTGEFSTNEFQFKGSFGLAFSKKFSVGAGFKFNLSDFAEGIENANSFGIDLGIHYRPSEYLSFGAAIQDLFAEQSLDTEDFFNSDGSIETEDTFPKRFKFGAAYQFKTIEAVISSEFEIRTQTSDIERNEINTFDGTPQVFSERDEITTSSTQWRVGGSYKVHERITGRLGYQIQDLDNFDDSDQFSFGFSLLLPFDTYSPAIDYAFVREPGGFSSFHVFAIQLNI